MGGAGHSEPVVAALLGRCDLPRDPRDTTEIVAGGALRAVVGTGDRGWRLIEVSRSVRVDGVFPEAAPLADATGASDERKA